MLVVVAVVAGGGRRPYLPCGGQSCGKELIGEEIKGTREDSPGIIPGLDR